MLFFWPDDEGHYKPLIIPIEGDGATWAANEDCCCAAVECIFCEEEGLTPVVIKIQDKTWKVDVSGIGEAWGDGTYDTCENNACGMFNGQYVQQEGQEISCGGVEIFHSKTRKCQVGPPPDNDYTFTVESIALDARKYGDECQIWMCVFMNFSNFLGTYAVWMEGLLITDPPDGWVFKGGTADEPGCNGLNGPPGSLPLGFFCDFRGIVATVS